MLHEEEQTIPKRYSEIRKYLGILRKIETDRTNFVATSPEIAKVSPRYLHVIADEKGAIIAAVDSTIHKKLALKGTAQIGVLVRVWHSSQGPTIDELLESAIHHAFKNGSTMVYYDAASDMMKGRLPGEGEHPKTIAGIPATMTVLRDKEHGIKSVIITKNKR